MELAIAKSVDLVSVASHMGYTVSRTESIKQAPNDTTNHLVLALT